MGVALLVAVVSNASDPARGGARAAPLAEYRAQMTPDMTALRWQERFGPPASDFCSGLSCLTYPVQGGGRLVVTFSAVLLRADLDGCRIWSRPRYDDGRIRAELKGLLERTRACKVPWIAAAVSAQTLPEPTRARMVKAVTERAKRDPEVEFWAAAVLALHGFNHGVPTLQATYAAQAQPTLEQVVARAALILAGERPPKGAGESPLAPELSRLTAEPLPEGPTAHELRQALARRLAELTESERDALPEGLRGALLVPAFDGGSATQHDGGGDIGGWWWDPTATPRPTLTRWVILSPHARGAAVIEVCRTGDDELMLWAPTFRRAWARPVP